MPKRLTLSIELKFSPLWTQYGLNFLMQRSTAVGKTGTGIIVSSYANVLTAELNLVLMTPGDTQFTLMFIGAHSTERAFVKPKRAVFDTE